MPPCTSASIEYATIGRFPSGSRCLFVIRVSGWRRVPLPPARMTPFMRGMLRGRESLLRANGTGTRVRQARGVTERPLMILVAGPYRSGTDDEPERIETNMRAMNEA